MSDHQIDDDQARELLELLATVFTPEGVEKWLEDADRKNLTMEQRLQLAEALASGSFM